MSMFKFLNVNASRKEKLTNDKKDRSSNGMARSSKGQSIVNSDVINPNHHLIYYQTKETP